MYELFSKFEIPEDGFRSNEDDIAIFEYRIEYVDDATGKHQQSWIVGYCDGHALEEAKHECSSYVYAVTREQFLYWQ